MYPKPAPRWDLITKQDLKILLASLARTKIIYSNYWDEEGRTNRARVSRIEELLLQNAPIETIISYATNTNTDQRKKRPQSDVYEPQTPAIQPAPKRDV